MNIADLRLEVLPGPGLVARWNGVVLVMPGPLDTPGSNDLVALVREVALAGVGGRALALRIGGFITAGGPESVPAFAIVADPATPDERPVVLVHGAAAAHVTGAEVQESLLGIDRPTWVDEYLPAGADRIAIGPPGAELASGSEVFDLVTGAVPGSGALLVADDRETEPDPAAAVEVGEPELEAEPEREVEAPPETEAEREAEAPPEAEAEEHEFRSVSFTPLTEDEIRAPLPVVGGDAGDREVEAVADAATVDGARCIRSHFNHPEARYCAHCGIGMVQQTHRLVRDVRPPLGILVFDDGTTLSLDASYVIGRDPSRDDAVTAGEARGFVLEDPDQILSRVHAEVRLTGWEVQLVDRHSANGTYVAGPGGEWERIEPDVPFTLAPGAKARVGRQEFVFDSHHRRD